MSKISHTEPGEIVRRAVGASDTSPSGGWRRHKTTNNQLGALWPARKTTRDGNAYWTGEILGRRVVMFSGKSPGDGRPAFLIYEMSGKE